MTIIGIVTLLCRMSHLKEQGSCASCGSSGLLNRYPVDHNIMGNLWPLNCPEKGIMWLSTLSLAMVIYRNSYSTAVNEHILYKMWSHGILCSFKSGAFKVLSDSSNFLSLNVLKIRNRIGEQASLIYKT